MSRETLWEEMLDEFRALGGIADNICLKEGRFGRGLFPCDPSLPVKVHIPPSLLLDLQYVAFDGDTFGVARAAGWGEREKAFLENYERDFSWGGGGRSDTENLLGMLARAPEALRRVLADTFGLGRWLHGGAPQIVQRRYFESRVISFGGRDVVMPIVELANHGYETEYVLEDGVGLSGQFGSEILVRYYSADSLEMFRGWGFVSNEPMALSLPMTLNTPAGPLRIGRDYLADDAKQRMFVPKIDPETEPLSLSYMLLGHKQFPRLARGAFCRAMREAGRPGVEEAFELVQHVNRMQFLNLIEAAEMAEPDLARLLRTLARGQLEAMSCSVGTRQM
jgi:hypothetical protein